MLDVCRYDPVTQLLDENHVDSRTMACGWARSRAGWSRHAELDLMARMAGLRLSSGWGGWRA